MLNPFAFQRVSCVGLDRVLFAVVAPRCFLAFDDRLNAHGALPDANERRQRLAGVVRSEIHTLMVVAEEKLAAIAEVAVLHVDVRVASVGELKEQLVFDLPELA